MGNADFRNSAHISLSDLWAVTYATCLDAGIPAGRAAIEAEGNVKRVEKAHGSRLSVGKVVTEQAERGFRAVARALFDRAGGPTWEELSSEIDSLLGKEV